MAWPKIELKLTERQNGAVLNAYHTVRWGAIIAGILALGNLGIEGYQDNWHFTADSVFDDTVGFLDRNFNIIEGGEDPWRNTALALVGGALIEGFAHHGKHSGASHGHAAH